VLKIKELTFQNIGRFVEEQRIIFSNLGNLIQVDGKNKNTGGSSGAAKTTVFNALDYLLGLNDIPNNILQSRLTKESIQVHGIFECDGINIDIFRSKKGLKIQYPDKVVEGSNKLAEEELDKILGMPRPIFRKMVHKRQKEDGFFLSFTPKQTYEFLTDCLNLSSYRIKINIVEQELKILEQGKWNIEKSLLAQQSALDTVRLSLSNLGNRPNQTIDKTEILNLKNKYSKLQSEYAEKEQQCKEKEKEIVQLYESELSLLVKPELLNSTYDKTSLINLESEKKRLESEINSLFIQRQNRLNEIQKNIAEKQIKINKLTYVVKEGEEAKVKAIDVVNQMKKIQNSICPTCEQTWIHEKAQQSLLKLTDQLKLFKEKVLNGNGASGQIPILESEITNLKSESVLALDEPRLTELDHALNDVKYKISEERNKFEEFNKTLNDSNRLLMEEYNKKQNDIYSRRQHAITVFNSFKSETLKQLSQDLYSTKSELDLFINNFKNNEESISRYDSIHDSLAKQEVEYNQKITSLQQNLINVNRLFEETEELKKCLKSFVSCLFDEALLTIGDLATKIIRCIPNMRNATIRFESTKETQDGKIKEEVTAIISSDGELEVPIKSLSGGEKSSVDLSIDLSVLDYLESKSSKGMNIFILDEPFTGLGPIEIEMVLEVLKNSNTNKQLLIVDHNEEVKQMMDSTILVVREGQFSTIQ
jgi:DNA repair exonuclease SbcCD ATPase subunit